MGKNDASKAQDKSVLGAQRANRGKRASIGDPSTPFSFESVKQPRSAARPSAMATAIERRQEEMAGISLREIHQRQLKKKLEPQVTRNDKGILVIRA